MSINHQLFKMLEKVIKNLDISPSVYKDAEEKYQAVGKWLADGEYCLIDKKICLNDGEIYVQGSIKIGTVVKPIGQEEFDIDLVFYTPNISTDDILPEELKKLIGDRLKSENSIYKDKVTSTNRGWCINYENKFHLDITPSLDKIDEPHNNSELVADKKLKTYMPSNPKDYAEWFDNISLTIPIIESTQRLFKSDIFMDGLSIGRESSITVHTLPNHEETKLLLQKFVQIFKRHRSEQYRKKSDKEKKDKPSSIIITTLATTSYLYCIENFSYNNEYDFMLDVLKYMPKSITQRGDDDWIENPTVNNENFAEKWNDKPMRKKHFYDWHNNCIKFFDKFNPDMGQDILFEYLEDGFGKDATQIIRDEYIQKLDDSRKNGLLSIATIAIPTVVKPNTFFGE